MLPLDTINADRKSPVACYGPDKKRYPALKSMTGVTYPFVCPCYPKVSVFTSPIRFFFLQRKRMRVHRNNVPLSQRISCSPQFVPTIWRETTVLAKTNTSPLVTLHSSIGVARQTAEITMYHDSIQKKKMLANRLRIVKSGS